MREDPVGQRMTEWETEQEDEAEEWGKPEKWGRFVTTAVTLFILISFLGVILITFYNQFTGRQTLPPQLPLVAFLQVDTTGTWQLFATDAPKGKTVRQLTQEMGNVLEFAVSSPGTAVAYAVARGDGGTELKLFAWNGREAEHHHTLLECPQATCTRLVWHPDGRRLIYERRSGNVPRLWWLDTQQERRSRCWKMRQR
jgi:hypothetical protein